LQRRDLSVRHGHVGDPGDERHPRRALAAIDQIGSIPFAFTCMPCACRRATVRWAFASP
jgi:hypothetical protein